MKYIIYCRKSTDTEDKQVLSLDSQERELLEFAEKHNLEVIETLKESMSAKEPGRPIFNEMIKKINSGKADAVLCWKIDRLTRNPIDGGQIQWLLQTNKIKCIQTFEKNYLPNDNVLLMSIEQAMANQYIRDLSINVKRGNREKLARGEWPNHAPLGYLNDKATKTIMVDKKLSKYIVRVFDLYSSGGHGVNEIVETLYKEGFRTRQGKKVYKNLIERILKNPFYVGLMLRDGKLYEGKHKPLISKSIYEKVKRVADDRSRPRPKTHFFPLRGFLKCENCGCLITASKKKGHDYYYCTNGRKLCAEHKSYLRENYLYKEIAKILGNLHISERKIELMYQSAKERVNADMGYLDKVLEGLQKELESSRLKESKLLDVFLDEQITKEIYDKKVLDLQNEQILIRKQIKDLEKQQPAFTLEPVKNIFLQANKSQKEFLDGDEVKKHEIVKNLLWNLTIKDKNIVKIQYKDVFEVISKMPKNGSILQMLPGQGSNLRPIA